MSALSRLAALPFWLIVSSSAVLPAGSTIEAHKLQSAMLGRTFAYTVYRPATGTATARLPVLYLFHGAGGDEHSWVRQGRVQEVADRLIATGEIAPLLIVMPGAADCWWVDDAPCNLEGALWQELEPEIALRSDVMPGRSARAVAGASAGGHGALRLALKDPDRFAAVAALSPAIYSEGPPPHSKARQSSVFARPGGAFEITLWSARNYPALLPAYGAGGVRIPIHIATGDRDEYGIAFEAALLHRQLQSLQPDSVELRISDGTHDWTYWAAAITDALRFVDSHLGAKHLSRLNEPLRAPTVAKAAAPPYGRL